MRFTLIDQIVDWEAGKTLRAEKHLTLAEEYLADHFPTFPVMPGVMMLQAMVEASAWLWRLTSGYEHSIIVLREVRNVKYGTFMEPGRTLELEVSMTKIDPVAGTAVFRGKGNVAGGAQTVAGQMTLAAYNLRDKTPELADLDGKILTHWKERAVLLTGAMRQVR